MREEEILYVISNDVKRDIMEFRCDFDEMIKSCSTDTIVLKNGGNILIFTKTDNFIGIRRYIYYNRLYNDFLKYKNRQLKEQNEKLEQQKQQVIDYCKKEIEIATIQYENDFEEQKEMDWCYKLAHERILEMLGGIKNESKLL